MNKQLNTSGKKKIQENKISSYERRNPMFSKVRPFLLRFALVAILVGVILTPKIVSANPPAVDYMRVPFIGQYNMSEACLNPTSNEYHRNGARYAIDASLPIGTPVYSPVTGTIVSPDPDSAGYGLTLLILDDHGLYTRLAHMAKLYVTNGSVVQGQLVGLSGDTGNGPAHLHWNVQTEESHSVAESGVNLDPVPGVNVINCNNNVVGTSTGPEIASNPYNWCPTFASEGYTSIALFDHNECKGNIKTLSGGVGYDLTSTFNDKTRSIYVPSNKSVFVSANNDGTGGWYCANQDKWNLDADKYWDYAYHEINKKIGWSDGGGFNMVSYAEAFNTPDCTINGTHIVDILSGGSYVSMYLWQHALDVCPGRRAAGQ